MHTEKGGGEKKEKIQSGKTCLVFGTLTDICQSQSDCSICAIEFSEIIYSIPEATPT